MRLINKHAKEKSHKYFINFIKQTKLIGNFRLNSVRTYLYVYNLNCMYNFINSFVNFINSLINMFIIHKKLAKDSLYLSTI